MISIETAKRISVYTGRLETRIDFEDMNGSTTRLELTRPNAEVLLSELQHVLSTK